MSQPDPEWMQLSPSETASQLSLFVFVLLVFGAAAYLLIKEFRRSGMACMAIAALFLAGCETAPVQVRPEITAARVQNAETKKHIKTFTSSNQRTRQHIEKSQESEARADDKLQSVKKDLEELLKP